MSKNQKTCIGRIYFHNTTNQTASFEVVSLNTDGIWKELNQETSTMIFESRGRVFKSLKMTPVNLCEKLDQFKFFKLICEENSNFTESEYNKDLYYAKSFTELIPIIDAPNQTKSFLEFQESVQAIKLINNKQAFLKWNNFYFKITKEKQQTTLEVKANDHVTSQPYKIDPENFITIHGNNYCTESAASPVFPCYYTGDDNSFIRFLKNRSKGYSTIHKEFSDLKDSLVTLSNHNDFFTESLSEYEPESLKERVNKLHAELCADQDICLGLLGIIKKSPYFKEQEKKWEEETRLKNRQTHTILETELQNALSKLKEKGKELVEYQNKLKAKDEELLKIKKEVKTDLKKTAHVDTLSADTIPIHEQALHEIPQEKDDRTKQPTTTPPWGIIPQDSNISMDIDEEKIENAISYYFRTLGCEEPIPHLDAFSRSGELPLLFGSNATSILNEYSKFATGCSYYKMDADPSTLSLDDLWRTPGTQSPTVFALAWEEASTSDDFVILNINIEESPCHLWIKSLFDVMQSNLRPQLLEIILTLDHCTITATDWIQYTIPIECSLYIQDSDSKTPVSKIIPSTNRTTFENSGDLNSKQSNYRHSRLQHIAPILAKRYPSWPEEIDEETFLAQSKNNLIDYIGESRND